MQINSSSSYYPSYLRIHRTLTAPPHIEYGPLHTTSLGNTALHYFSIPEQTSFSGFHYFSSLVRDHGHCFLYKKLLAQAQFDSSQKIPTQSLFEVIKKLAPFVKVKRECLRAQLYPPSQLPQILRSLYRSFFREIGEFLPLDFHDRASFDKTFVDMMNSLSAYIAGKIEMFFPHTSRRHGRFISSEGIELPSLNCLEFVLFLLNEQNPLPPNQSPPLDFFVSLGYENVADPKSGDVIIYFNEEETLITHVGLLRSDGFVDSKIGRECSSVFSLHPFDTPPSWGRNFAFFRKKPI
jgi:hypothetical protein